MDKNRIRGIIIALIMGVVAIVLANKYLEQEVKRKAASLPKPQEQQEASVLIATKEIPRGQAIERGMISLKKFPLNSIQPGAINSVEATIDKIALVDILENEQITFTKLASSRAQASSPVSALSMRVPSGKRAITVPIDTLSAVGGMVKAGDYVDIIANFPFPQVVEGKQTTQLVTVTLFQNVLVLAVGGQIQEMAQASGRRQAETPSPQPPSQVTTITFALIPQEAELISFAQEQGRLKLILRSPLDTSTQTIPTATWDTLLQYILSSQGVQPSAVSQEIPQPGTETESGKPVEIYHAGQQKQ